MSKDQLEQALRPFSKLIIGLLFAGNIFFVSKLVTQIDSMEESITQLTIKVAVLETKTCRKKAEGPEARRYAADSNHSLKF